MSTSAFLLKRHGDIGRAMTKPPPPPYDQCLVDKRTINCWRKNVYGVGVQMDNPTYLQTTPQTQAIAAGSFTRGECVQGACPLTTFDASTKPPMDPAASLGYGGEANVAADRMAFPTAGPVSLTDGRRTA